MVEKIFEISMIVFSIWYSMLPDEIFGKLGNWLSIHLPKKLHNPVFDCFVCMCPYYGTIIYFAMPYIPKFVIVVIAAMGLNAVLSKLFPPHKIEIEDSKKNISDN